MPTRASTASAASSGASASARALRSAEFSVGAREDALELVQEAMLGFVRRYAMEKYDCRTVTGLEGDDVIGLIATGRLGSLHVICSIDKDLKTIPGSHYNFSTDEFFEVTEEERETFWEKLYSEPGFGIWMANFRDVLTDPKANALFSDFVARKIRQRVEDPALVPELWLFTIWRYPPEVGRMSVDVAAMRRRGCGGSQRRVPHQSRPAPWRDRQPA